VGFVGDCICTLLGPEGPGTTLVVTFLWAFSVVCFGRWRDWYRPYFENYTVDASIFEMTSVISYR
jgi:hypothetical protein